MQAYGRDILFKVMDTIVEISKEQERRIMQIEMIKNFYFFLDFFYKYDTIQMFALHEEILEIL